MGSKSGRGGGDLEVTPSASQEFFSHLFRQLAIGGKLTPTSTLSSDVFGRGDDGTVKKAKNKKAPSKINSPRGDELELLEIKEEEDFDKALKLKELCEETHFTLEEVSQLYESIIAMLAPCGNGLLIDYDMFKRLMMPLNTSKFYMMKRVFSVLDENGDGFIAPSEFMTGMSTILRGAFADQIAFAFSVYDYRRQGVLTPSDVLQCLRESSQLDKSTVDGLYSLIFPKLDVDSDGRITFSDFYSACVKDPTLLECLGPCFPKEANGHNAHRIPHGEVSNQTSSLDYLTRTSVMSKLCNPILKPEGSAKLEVIALKQKKTKTGKKST